MRLNDLFGFLFNYDDEANLDHYRNLENSIKEKTKEGKVTRTEYEENGMKIIKEEYSSEDGKISWSRTTYEEISSIKEINNLKKQLNEAIKVEDFEKAVKLRDQIKEKSSKK